MKKLPVCRCKNLEIFKARSLRSLTTQRYIVLSFFAMALTGQIYSLKNHSIHSIFTLWVVTSVITCFGVNIQ